jgi:hypothetical protein
MAARLSALRAGRFLPPGKFLVLMVRLERLGKLKKSTSFETRTGDLPACSMVPHPTTLPRDPRLVVMGLYFGNPIYSIPTTATNDILL